MDGLRPSGDRPEIDRSNREHAKAGPAAICTSAAGRMAPPAPHSRKMGRGRYLSNLADPRLHCVAGRTLARPTTVFRMADRMPIEPFGALGIYASIPFAYLVSVLVYSGFRITSCPPADARHAHPPSYPRHPRCDDHRRTLTGWGAVRSSQPRRAMVLIRIGVTPFDDFDSGLPIYDGTGAASAFGPNSLSRHRFGALNEDARSLALRRVAAIAEALHPYEQLRGQVHGMRVAGVTEVAIEDP